MRVIVKEAGRARCPRPLDTAGEEPAEGHGPALSPGHSLERGGSCGALRARGNLRARSWKMGRARAGLPNAPERSGK